LPHGVNTKSDLDAKKKLAASSFSGSVGEPQREERLLVSAGGFHTEKRKETGAMESRFARALATYAGRSLRLFALWHLAWALVTAAVTGLFVTTGRYPSRKLAESRA
jgi:hypothetical protein